MNKNTKNFELNIMARVFNVTTDAFWMWKKRGESQRKQEDAVLLDHKMHLRAWSLREEIKIIHANSKRTYGAPRVKASLLEEKGKQISRSRVGRLMREAGLQTKYKERFVITTKSKNSSNVADNVLNRAFKAEKPNQKWVSDIT